MSLGFPVIELECLCDLKYVCEGSSTTPNSIECQVHKGTNIAYCYKEAALLALMKDVDVAFEFNQEKHVVEIKRLNECLWGMIPNPEAKELPY